MELITDNGIYDVDEKLYHNVEICASPSISSSGLRTIINECPAKFWHGSTLNPDREPVEKQAWSFGRAAHFYILEGEAVMRRAFMVIPDDLNLNSKEGRAAKKQAQGEGRQILRAADVQIIKEMADAIVNHRFISAAFENCDVEKTLVYKDEETGIYLRIRPDVLPKQIGHIPDYKTSRSAKPDDFAKAVWSFGYHMQAEFYMRVIEQVTGVKPKSFIFVVQEKTAPYVVTPFVIDEDALEWARIQNRKALHIFAECLENNYWPGYAKDIIPVTLPAYAQYELMRRDSSGNFTVEEKDEVA